MLLQKAQIYFVLGGPGAGKGTQSQKLVEKYGFIHLSAGDLLREERRSGSSNGDLIESYILQGKIVPDKIYLIDGFPRNQENFDQWLKFTNNKIEFKRLLFFDCDQQTMMNRILKRAQQSGRSDDNRETLFKRFQVYQEETKPIIDYFQTLGLVAIIKAEGQQDEIFNQLVQLIEQIK